MFGQSHSNRSGVRSRLGVGLAGLAVLALGVALMVWPGVRRGVDRRIIECGFDAKGPYAKVRITSGLDGLRTEHLPVGVTFTYDGVSYTDQPGIFDGLPPDIVELPAFGNTTTVVHGLYPPRVLDHPVVVLGHFLTDDEPTTTNRKGDKHKVKVAGGRDRIVEGRTVYRNTEPPYELVSKEFVDLHPRRYFSEEVAPDDVPLMACVLPPLRDTDGDFD